MTEIHNQQSGLDIQKAKANLAYSGQKMSESAEAFGETVSKARDYLGEGAKGYAKSMLLAQHNVKYKDQPEPVRTNAEKLSGLINPAATGAILASDLQSDPSSAKDRKMDIGMSMLDAASPIPVKGVAGMLVSKNLLDSLNGLWKKTGKNTVDYVPHTSSMAGSPQASVESFVKAEVSDASSRVLDAGFTTTSNGLYQVVNAPLGDIMTHDDLYSIYPSLRQYQVVFDPKVPIDSGYIGGNVVRLGFQTDREGIRKILLHEIQHGVQRKQGWARGGTQKDLIKRYADGEPEIVDTVNALYGNPALDRVASSGQGEGAARFRTLLNKSSLTASETDELHTMRMKAATYSAYLNIAGEKEARATANRAMMLKPVLEAVDRSSFIGVPANDRVEEYATVSSRILSDAVANGEVSASELIQF